MKTFPALILFFASIAHSAEIKPNILFIAIDDLRPELGCYGSTQVKSPHIDKLAAEGMVFTRAYCQVPVCGASRASLLTGMLPTHKRFVNYDTQVEKDAPGAITLEKDPDENVNVASHPEYRETVRTMAALLKQRQEEAERFQK